MLKAAAPLLFPGAAIVVYGDTKCVKGEHVFPAARLARLLRERFPRASLAALQHWGHFSRPLSLEFARTITRMLDRKEHPTVFDDIVALRALLGGVLDVNVPMIDAVCLVFRSGGAADGGAEGGTAGGAAASVDAGLRGGGGGGGGSEMFHAALRLSLAWTALVERFSMREQLSFNAAAALALAPEWAEEKTGAGAGRGSGGFMGFAPGVDWRTPMPLEADGIAYVDQNDF